MAPQHLDQKMTMNHEHQQGLDDAEHLTSDPPSASQASPDDLFRYIDQQYAEAKAEFDACEARRKEIVREMAQHMQTLESDDDDDEDDDDSSVYQRHTELTMQLSGIKREQKKLRKKLASITSLSDKRKDVETLMRRRISAASSGGANNFSVEELHQIIESQAFATLEVEILNQERNLLEIQLIETKKQTERLLIQCSEKDERIKVLKEQNLSYQHEIVRLSQTEAPSVGSQVSLTEITQLSSLRYNLLAESEHIRKRLTDRTNNLTSLSSLSSASSRPTAPPSTVHTIGATNLESQVSAFTTSSTNIRPTIPHPTVHTIRTTNLESQTSGFTTTSAASTTVGRPIVPPPLTVQISQSSQAPTPQITNNNAVPNTMPFNPRGNVGELDDSERRTISDSERRIDDSERTEEERRESRKQQHLLDEIAKEQEKALREKALSQEASEEEERMRIEQQRKRQQQKREQWLRDEAAKEEERKIRELQEQLQEARQAKESNVPIPSEKAITTGRLASIPEGDAKRASMEQQVQRQSQRPADRMASTSVMSPTPSTRRTVPARATLSPTPSTDSSNDSGKNRAYNDMARSAHGGNRVGAMRMKPSGTLEEENEDEDDSFSNGDEFVSSTSLIEAISDAYSHEAVAQRGSGYTVTATLVEDENDKLGMSERERQFEARERELEAREAEIAKQAKSFQSLTAEVVPAAVAVATISRNGSYRTTTSALGSMESLNNSSGHGSYRTTHSVGAASGDHLNTSNRMMGGDASLRELGSGPLRFYPKSERPLREQFNGMADSDYYCYSQLQERWEKKRKEKGGAAYSEKLILRFLYHTCKKDGSFQVAKAWKAMKKTKERNLFLSAAKLEKQLLTAVSLDATECQYSQCVFVSYHFFLICRPSFLYRDSCQMLDLKCST